MATFRNVNSCRIAGVFAAMGAALTLCVSTASAVTFTVNTEVDGPDDNPGDGLCATSSGACSLRAAIEETNVLIGPDTVDLPAGQYLVGDPTRLEPVHNPLTVLDSLFIIGAGAEQSIIDGAADTPVMLMSRVEALVLDSSASGPDGVDALRVPNGASSSALPYIAPGSGGLDFAVDLVRGGSEVDDDLLAISFTQGVLRYDLDTGAFVGVHIEPTIPSGTLNPVAIAGGRPPDPLLGELFVSNFQSGGGVVRFDGATGDFVSEFVPAGTGGLSFPGGMIWKYFFQQDYDLLVVSTGSDSVLRYNGDGSFIETFASGGLLSTPRDIVERGTSVYVTSQDADAVLEYDGETGDFIGTFVPAGEGGLDEPTDLEFGPDGDLYVRSGETQQILRFDGQTGDFKAVFAAAGSQGLGAIGGFTLISGRAGTGPIVNGSGITIANGDTDTGGLTSGLTVGRGFSATLSSSTIRDNASSIFGGGIRNNGDLTLFDVAVTGNTLPNGPGAGGGQTSAGGGIFTSGFLTLDRCLISNNTSIRGGGINVNSGNAEITNTTISGNNADGSGGGLRIVGGRVFLNFSTITGNTANKTTDESNREGGGVYLSAPFGLDVANSIIAGNIDAEGGGGPGSQDVGFSPDCFTDPAVAITSFRDNLIGILDENNCSIGDTIFGDLGSIQYGTPLSPLDARLLGLNANGGPTYTHALATSGPASPAIDADLAGTSATFFDCPAVDQRGFPRPSGAACDIGAYEVQFAPPESFLPANSSSTCTGAANCTVESWGVDLNADTGYLWNVDGGTGGSADLFLGVASPSGTRAMGLRVNGTQVAVISTTSGASPRPTGSEFGAYTVTLNPGNNTVELVDNQGTAELDAHYLRVESSQGVCGNNVCASSESCDACSADCGQCGVEPGLQFAEGVQDCTGAANCTEESWGIDLNADTGYKWIVSGGEAGGAVELFVKVAVLSGSRAMGLLVNGSQIAVVSTSSTQSPRPDGTELGAFLAMLNPGDNTVELVDNQSTAEFDVHYLRVEPLPESPCSSFCSNPTAISWSGSYQSGNLGTGAVCLETTQPVAGGNCGNFAAGRQLFVNGTQMPCNAGNWTSLPASVNGGYCVQVTPGGASYAYASLW